MKKNSKIFIAAGFAATGLFVASLLLTNSSRAFLTFGTGTNTASTVWGHYERLNPTLDTPGCQEFWISCDSHNVVFEEPTSGTVQDRGVPTVANVQSWQSLDDGRYIDPIQIDSTHFRYGEYPQTKVDNSSELYGELKAKLISLGVSYNDDGSLPKADAGKFDGWTKYTNYFKQSGSPLKLTQMGNAFYKDFRNGSKRYRAVYFRELRPFGTTATVSNTNSYVDENGYAVTTLYFFEIEPITWTKLSDGRLLADKVLDSTQFHRSYGTDTYSNKYENSDMRTYLTGQFFDHAFSFDKSIIQTMTVDNSLSSTNGNITDEEQLSNDTNDKITLLSHAEALTLGNANSDRLRVPSDYALSQGVYSNGTGYASWALRSPYQSSKGSEQYDAVSQSGGFITNAKVIHNHRGGIMPVIDIGL